MDEQRPINPEEKLEASTTVKVINKTSETVTIENWTCGFVFLIDSITLEAGKEGHLKAEYVWYDYRAKNTSNQVLTEKKGVYYNKVLTLVHSYEFTVAKK